MDGIELQIDEDVLEYIVDKAIEFKLGARGLRSICEAIMIDPMFEMPSAKSGKLHIDLKFAQTKLEKINFNKLKVA